MMARSLTLATHSSTWVMAFYSSISCIWKTGGVWVLTALTIMRMLPNAWVPSMITRGTWAWLPRPFYRLVQNLSIEVHRKVRVWRFFGPKQGKNFHGRNCINQTNTLVDKLGFPQESVLSNVNHYSSSIWKISLSFSRNTWVVWSTTFMLLSLRL